jgi:hydroxymethylpyrimidine pyrophosphatase-like HAD family hydrolase
MNTALELQQERNQVRSDLLAGKKPKRVFIVPSFTMEAVCGLAKVSLIEVHYNNMALKEKALTMVCETFYSDVGPSMSSRFPGIYQQLGAKNWIISSNGTVQHPEIETMHVEEYDEFIATPYKTMVEKFLPRVCTALDTDPVTRSLKLAAAYGAYKNSFNAQYGVAAKLIGQYGYAPGFITNQMIVSPFDFLAGQLRGFRAITIDIRRCPDKVKAAVEAVTPLMIKMAVPTVMRPGLISLIPLHLAPFISMKAFEELYWPTFEKVIVELDKKGIACCLFVEQDWTRYCEYLERLPKSTIMYMEAGDPKRFTETVGKDHIFAGFYDPTITLSRSKEECIDEAKKLLDTCMKSDHFYFTFDKPVIDIKSVDVPKLQAVLEWVRENGKY